MTDAWIDDTAELFLTNLACLRDCVHVESVSVGIKLDHSLLYVAPLQYERLVIGLSGLVPLSCHSYVLAFDFAFGCSPERIRPFLLSLNWTAVFANLVHIRVTEIGFVSVGERARLEWDEHLRLTVLDAASICTDRGMLVVFCFHCLFAQSSHRRFCFVQE